MEIGNIVKIGKKYCKNCQDYKSGECKLFGGKAFNACVFYTRSVKPTITKIMRELKQQYYERGLR